MKFLVKVPAEITAHETIGCMCPRVDGPMTEPHGPRCVSTWRAQATLEGRNFDLYDKPHSHPTEAKAIAAGKREMVRRIREWNAKQGL
jgi:hypothetical protein